MIIQDRVGKLAIGHVGHGKMLIQEMLDYNLSEPKKKELGYDLCDDMMCFMNNEPTFYRKQYFPVMHKFKEYVQSGKDIHPRAFESLVRKAFESYKNRYQVEGIEEALDKEMVEKICNEIHRVEVENIKHGHYDDRK